MRYAAFMTETIKASKKVMQGRILNAVMHGAKIYT